METMDTGQESLISLLAGRGIRLTRQRRIVTEVLDTTPGHVSAAALLREAQSRDPRINRATVYRTLFLLKTHGLIDELDLLHLEGDEHYYERRQRRGHVHIGCRGCGRIHEMDSDHVQAILDEIRRKTGYDPESIRIEVRARCAECTRA